MLISKKMNRQRGFSLVELMVAVVIGLIGTVVMFQVFAVSEGQKRSTTSGGDSQQNGSVALFTLERDLRNTAHGIRPLITLGRPMYSEFSGAVQDPIIFRPILITPGTNSDSVAVTYSTSDGVASEVYILGDWNSNAVPNAQINVASTAGLTPGDQIAICPNQTANPLEVCVRGEATALLTDGNGGWITLAAPPAVYMVGANAITPKFNPAGFKPALNARVGADGLILPTTYLGGGDEDVSAAVYNLGPLITRTYAIQNGQLTLNDGTATTEFANGIVSMRAQYGLDTNGDSSVDAWVNPRAVQANPRASYTPNHPSFLIGSDAQIAASWGMVIAARVAIVVRSDNIEKEVVESRGYIPLWTNSNGDAAPSYTVPGGDGSHYRYRVFESIVPFRNMIW